MDDKQSNGSTKDAISVLNGITEKVRDNTKTLDNQLNILIGISSAIIVFAVSNQNISENLALIVIAIFSAISICIAMTAIHPFKFLRKKDRVESIMSNVSVSKYPSYKEYFEQLKNVLDDKNKIIEQYSIDIYYGFKYYYRPKRNMYNYARNFLITGIVLFALILGYDWIKDNILALY